MKEQVGEYQIAAFEVDNVRAQQKVLCVSD
jgi:hypothetical protein